MQMPQNTFLAVIILIASAPLYSTTRRWVPPWPGWTATALDDQQLAAGIMWVGGDLLFIAAIGAVVWGWDARRGGGHGTCRSPRRRRARRDPEREAALAERRAEVGRPGTGGR